jgi:hypothetical protein
VRTVLRHQYFLQNLRLLENVSDADSNIDEKKFFREGLKKKNNDNLSAI